MSNNPSPGFRDRPDHKIAVTPYSGLVVVTVDETKIASTRKALKLQEASYPPVFYIPFSDIDFESLSASGTKTHCPFKGDASYWSATVDGRKIDDVMWAYQEPFDEMSGIKDFGAFYPNKVKIEATEV